MVFLTYTSFTFQFDLTQSFVESLIYLMVRNKIRIAQFNFGICRFSCDPSTFCQLLPSVSLTELCIMTSSATQSDFSAQILASPEAKQVSSASISSLEGIHLAIDFTVESTSNWLPFGGVRRLPVIIKTRLAGRHRHHHLSSGDS